jgi:hypothetical protein
MTSPYPKHFVGQALLIYCTPKIILLTIYFYEDLIDEKGVAITLVLSPQSSGIF